GATPQCPRLRRSFWTANCEYESGSASSSGCAACNERNRSPPEAHPHGEARSRSRAPDILPHEPTSPETQRAHASSSDERDQAPRFLLIEPLDDAGAHANDARDRARALRAAGARVRLAILDERQDRGRQPEESDTEESTSRAVFHLSNDRHGRRALER